MSRHSHRNPEPRWLTDLIAKLDRPFRPRYQRTLRTGYERHSIPLRDRTELELEREWLRIFTQ